MSALKIECPHCSQHIAYDERYCGIQINCPACQRELTIPSLPAAAPSAAAPAPEIVAPPPNALRPAVAPAIATVAAKPAIRVAPSPSPAPATPAAPPAPRPVPVPRPMTAMAADDDDGPPMSKGKKIGMIAAIVVIAPVALYFLFSTALKMQAKFNETQAKDDDPGIIGGQVSHVMELNQVLDATDPDKMGRFDDDEPAAGMAGKARKARSVAVGAAGAAGAMDPAEVVESLPATPATWSMDLATAKIPDGRVAGTVAGSKFVAERVALLTGGPTPLLMFGQGDINDGSLRELALYLKLKPGEKLENKTWMIAKEQTADVPQLLKRWNLAPKQPFQQKTFANGYVMKLEFGKMTPDGLPGKIYVALPDAEQSAAGGSFLAVVRVIGAAGGGRRNPTVDLGDE